MRVALDEQPRPVEALLEHVTVRERESVERADLDAEIPNVIEWHREKELKNTIFKILKTKELFFQTKNFKNYSILKKRTK